LAAALSTAFAGAAQADPAVSANYRLNLHQEQAGDWITMGEFDLTPPDAQVTRRIDWGDGSPIQTETKGDSDWKHTYAKAGTFHVSVDLQGDGQTTAGTFPDGNTIEVFADAPPDLLSANYHLVPDHVRVKEPVTLAESNLHGDDGPPVYVFRYINWGDGTPEEEYSGAIRPNPHKYAKPGTYHVSVRLTNLQWHTAGKFPDGNTVTVTAAPTSGSGNAGNGSGTGSGLPVTGPGALTLGAAGLALLLAGAVTFALLRRRRIRFVG
jgi:hypothetical protein